MLKLNGYFWHDLILNLSGIIKTSQKIYMSEKPVRGPSGLCWDKHSATSALPLHGSQERVNFWLSPGEHGYLTATYLTKAYLGIPGWYVCILHDCTWYILQTAAGISFRRLLSRAGGIFSHLSSQGTACECGDV